MVVIERRLDIEPTQLVLGQARFDVPILAVPRISADALLKTIGLRQQIPITRFKCPNPLNQPYIFWVSTQPQHPGQSLEEVKTNLASDEALINPAELASTYLQHPELFARRALIAGDGDYGGFYAHISPFAKPIELFVARADFRHARYEVLIKRKKVDVL